jgi:hypothetical protein
MSLWFAGYTLRNGQIVNIRRVAQVELPSHYGISPACGIWPDGITPLWPEK